MSGRQPPSKTSALVIALQREAVLKGFTGYGLTKATGLPLRTVQRFLAGEGSPTLATVETIAAALGFTVVHRPR